MAGTMTWVGLDVHARSTHAAAIDTMTGELTRVRFGPGTEGPLAWLGELPGPVRACYEAGPTGFGLYRAATAGIGMQVVAPGKTPRGPSDRVKTDRKDVELLAGLLLAGSLTRVVVPPPEVEAARELTRAHDACRRDLMTARHRVSKMLLRHGRVYPKSTTWTAEHRRWLSLQHFDERASELVFADLLAAVDGLSSRKAAIALRLSGLATDEQWWPTVARLRSFRGIDTLTAFSLHLEHGYRHTCFLTDQAAPASAAACRRADRPPRPPHPPAPPSRLALGQGARDRLRPATRDPRALLTAAGSPHDNHHRRDARLAHARRPRLPAPDGHAATPQPPASRSPPPSTRPSPPGR
jgi:hypothetical protein